MNSDTDMDSRTEETRDRDPSASVAMDHEESTPLVEERAKTKSTLEKVWKFFVINLLLILTAISVILGLILGASLRTLGRDRVLISWIGMPGELLLRMLKMLIIPLIVFSLIAGLGSLDSKAAGKLGRRTVLYYFATTTVAILLGLAMVYAVRPGERHPPSEKCDNSSSGFQAQRLETSDAVLDILRNCFPDNLFTAAFQQTETRYKNETIVDWDKCAQQWNESTHLHLNGSSSLNCSFTRNWLEENNLTCENATETKISASLGPREGMNILGIVIFTVAFALVLARVPDGDKVIAIVAVMNEAIMRLVGIVIWYSPIGIASLIAGKIMEIESLAVLVEELGFYMIAVLLGLFLHSFLFLPLLYLTLTRKNPLKVVRAALQALLTAFGTSSSSATLPVTIRNLEQNFKADTRVTRFMLPVGATINMDGTALYEAVAAVFIAQLNGVANSFVNVLIIVVTATAASVGAAGVPSAGLYTMVIILTALGLPTDDIAYLLAVDWLLDRCRTTVNVLGDCFGVGIVQHLSRKDLALMDQLHQQSSHSGEQNETTTLTACANANIHFNDDNNCVVKDGSSPLVRGRHPWQDDRDKRGTSL